MVINLATSKTNEGNNETVQKQDDRWMNKRTKQDMNG